MRLILFQIFTNSIEYQWPWVIYSEYIFAWWDIIMIHTCCMVLYRLSVFGMEFNTLMLFLYGAIYILFM